MRKAYEADVPIMQRMGWRASGERWERSFRPTALARVATTALVVTYAGTDGAVLPVGHAEEHYGVRNVIVGVAILALLLAIAVLLLVVSR
jgi:hypothetical protein